MAEQERQYLDLTGLEYLWHKAEDTFAFKNSNTDTSDQTLLEKKTIPGTRQIMQLDQSNHITGILHKNGDDIVRSDVWSQENGVITEVRTLNTGSKLTIVTDTRTLVTTTTFEEAEGSGDGS